MHWRKWGTWGLIIILGFLLPSGVGCAFHRTGQGWMIQSCWSLEFKRMLCCSGGATECSGGCAVPIPKEPGCTSGGDEESEVLHEANPKQLEKLDNSLFARLMGRCGRLGICANCGRLARFNGPGAGEKPAEPVIARFVPVPTQPVFCPRGEAMQPVSYERASKPKGQESSAPAKKSQFKAPLPEEIPPPPITSDVDKSSAAVPKQPNATQEQTSWIFSTPPEKKPEQLIEAQLPPRPSERATR